MLGAYMGREAHRAVDGVYTVETPDGEQVHARLVVHQNEATVEIFSLVAAGLPVTVELLQEINSVNASEFHFHLVHEHNFVTANSNHLIADLHVDRLVTALTEVGRASSQYGNLFATYFCTTTDEHERGVE